MVIYDLECDSGHTFEGWFANAADFSAQQENALLCCPMCDSIFVEKKLSAPKLVKSSGTSEVASDEKATLEEDTVAQPVKETRAEKKRQYLEYQEALKTVHDYVEKNFDDVGSKFTEKAIAMHNGELEQKNIRGTATVKQAKELRERGVSALGLPRKPVDKDKLN